MRPSKLLLFSAFAALGLGKITDSKYALTGTLDQVYTFLHLYSIKGFELIDFGVGFETTSHLFNILITYTPIFFIVLMFIFFTKKMLMLTMSLFMKMFSVKKKVVRKVEEPKKAKLSDFKPKRKSSLVRIPEGMFKITLPKFSIPKISFEKKPKKVYETHPIGAFWLLKLVIGKDTYRTLPLA